MPTVIDLSALGTSGFIVQGDTDGDQAGFSVSMAGDVNGDGFDDFIVGAINGDEGGSNAGEAYVIFGRARGLTLLDLTGLAPTDGFIIQGDAANDLAGYSVSSAGDVNGDGFDDLIVGSRDNDAGGSNAGAAYVVFGKASGFATIDLATLAAPDGFVIQGDAAGDQAGFSASSAGDINGDGFDDIIVGAQFGDDGGADAGEAYVIFGKAGAFGNLDLTALAPADGFIIQGDLAGDRAGCDVASAGDINGDGYDDIIVGASVADDGGINAGEAYVIFGKASGFANIDLTSLAATDGFVIQGDAEGDRAGISVSSAGDINRDGFDDFLVGASQGEDGEVNAGETYVIFGKATGFANLDLTTLAPADGFVIRGDATADQAGFSLASAGDVNGDGFGDIIIGAPYGDDGGVLAGEAYVIFGKASGFSTIDLTGLDPADGFIIQGDAIDDRAGVSVSGAGDVDGDGFDDLIVGARFGDDGGNNAGEAYIIYGFGPSDFPLLFELREDVSPVSGLTILGDTPSDAAGWSVSSAGDVNGDGLDDFIVGARFGDDGGTNAGEAYLIFGRTDGVGTIDLTGLVVADGIIIKGDLNTDQAGFDVSSAGDINGDGFDDLMIGTPYDDDAGASAGAAYVIFGKAGGFSNIDLAQLDLDEGFKILGDAAGDQAGWSVSSAGDVNGDGFDDMIVGARQGDDGGADAGEAYVIFGKASGFTLTVDLTGLASRPADGFIIQGDLASDNAGHSVSSAGDVNADGYDDLIVGVPLGDDGGSSAGEAYVIFGKASGFATIDLASLSATDGFIIRGDDGDQAGFSVSSAGDFNGDGLDDLIVGAPYGGGNIGEAYVVFGKASGFGTVDLAALAATDGFLIEGDLINDRAGWSVSSAGDVDGDGFDDLIVGAFRNDAGGGNSGQAYLIFGKASGFATIDVDALTAADGFVIQGAGGGDNTGRDVSSAGDVNGDGFDDLILGAHYGDLGGADNGEAYVIFGRKPTKAVIRTGAAGDQTIRGGDFGDVLSGLGGVDILHGASGDDALAGGAGADTLQGGAGIDGADYAGNFGAVKVDLTTGLGRFNYAEGDVLTDIENVFGTEYGDILIGNSGVNVLVGNAGDDTIMGGAGADTMNGGTGTDLADYAGNFGAVSVNLATGVGLFNYAQGDVLTDFENVNGTEYGDILTGSAGVNVLNGNGGDDTISGGAGADTLNGGAGTDTLTYAGNFGGVSVNLVTGTGLFNYAQGDVLTNFENVTGTEYGDILTGSSGVNVLNGNGGDDTISGGAAGDTLSGGAGTDTLTYAGNFGGISIDLLANVALFNYAQGDVISGFENVVGTSYGDILRGNSGVNVLTGGAGNDTLDGGTGADVLDGGADVDTADYAGEFGGISINLATGTGRFNAAEGDVLTGIEKVIGTSYGDIFESSNVANTFTGGAGNDEFKFNPGFALDVITDFAGNGAAAGDTVRFAPGLFTDYNDMIASSAQVGSDVVITLDASNTLTLQNTTLASLDSSDFLFG